MMQLIEYKIVILHKLFLFMHMNNPSSGIWEDAELRINSTYNILEELPSSPLSRIVVASRYGRRLLLKCLPADRAGDMRYLEALIKEFEILSALSHENVVNAVSMDEVPSLGLCIVMEYIEGVPLNEFVDDSTPRKVKLRLLQDTLSALVYIHGKQIVHRDLKPSNILVTDSGQVKIIDFGLSDSNSYEILKQPAGTLGYVSPEQQAGLPADPRNDIYSLGVIMREMQLGWMYAPIVKRCTGELKKRPSAEALQKMLQRPRLVSYALIAVFVVIALSIIPLFYNTTEAPAPAQKTIVQPDTVYKAVIIKDTVRGTEQQPVPQPVTETERIPRDQIMAEAKRMIDKDLVSEVQYWDTITNAAYIDQSHFQFQLNECKKLYEFAIARCHGYDHSTAMEIYYAIMDYYSKYANRWSEKIKKLTE